MAKRLQEGFLTRLYDFWQPHLDEDEMTFYLEQVKNADGPILELACGSGRLLLPLAKEGFDIEGVESSLELVELLKKRAKGFSKEPKIYHQRLNNLEIRKKYKLIFIALGSLQLVSDREEVKLLLSQLKGMLSEGGKLIISLFIPWMGGPVSSDEWHIVSDVTDKETKMRYIRREKSAHDPVGGLIEGIVRYEVWKGRDLLELEERNLKVRWYSKCEFEYMLKEAKFHRVKMTRNYYPEKGDRPGFMLFTAS